MNFHDVSGSSFRVILRGQTIKITPNVISSTIHVPRVIHSLFPYLSIDTLPTDSFIRSTLFNSPLGGDPQAIHTESFPTD